MKKLLAIVVLGCSVLLAPSDGFSRYRGHDGHHGGYPGGGYYYGGHRDHHGGHHDRPYGGHRDHYNNDFYWGATGFLFGTAFGAALYPPPVYGYNQPVYSYPPPMCRYERYMTDPWGRTYREAFVAPCR